MKVQHTMLLALALSIATAPMALAQDYDLVIKNGRVMDPESNLYRLMLRDGRTTMLDMEIGAHGPKLNEWYMRREGQSQLNYGVAVAHEFARAEVLDGFRDWKYLYTHNQVLALIDEGLQQGGLGIGSTVSVTALAQEDLAKESIDLSPTPLIKQAATADEIARELANPNTVLGSLNFNFDYFTYKGDLPGASDQSATRVTFQPVLPYPISKSTNFYLRPAVPVVISQDVPTAGGFDNKGVELGDIGFDAAVGRSLPGGYVVVGGVVGTLPTATDDALGLDQWLLGPEVAFAKVSKWGVLGLLVSHQWDVAGEGSFSTSITGGQYFYTYNLSNGWQISSSPTFSYNHEAASGQRWTLPVGFGVSKTTILGGQPWKFGLQYWQYVKQADAFGQDWEVRFTITPVVSLPWGKN